jgi:mono/diheme cytochrome c family protein
MKVKLKLFLKASMPVKLKRRSSKMRNIFLITILSMGFLACTKDKEQPNFELIQDMMESPAVRAQEYDDTSDTNGPRTPPEHTQPVGFKPYAIEYNVDLAKADKNPYAGSQDPEVLLTGQKFFETNCMICHGHKGLGDGTVAAKMPNKPPPLVSDKIKGWADGQIYQVISMGQGTMGSYASHIPQAYRWQVVNYIRHLQGK